MDVSRIFSPFRSLIIRDFATTANSKQTFALTKMPFNKENRFVPVLDLGTTVKCAQRDAIVCGEIDRQTCIRRYFHFPV